MTKAEWSGWAQAAGSFLALLLAIGLAWKARRDAQEDAADIAITFVAGVISALEDVRDACKKQDWEDFRACRLLLRDAVQAGDHLNSSMAPLGVAPKVMAVRAGAIEAFYKSEGHTAVGNWEHWRASFAGRSTAARLLLKEMKNLLR